ncbi:MAG: dinitrogenase iron-molybdenum cofactor biosynthesis protein [Zetaproteobacteria bacterium CG06_land_8_20_14_3_00_59_53]|nr:MAG: hypothetical protein AUK36_05740 [Zetaproteobacteria bacterium CG2_30_59_37]PIO90554.1 MAG: dinitrogenase iron-molybdenum cofactor biosynthesis protein [Zetaproteobacteria bacterium CG23_combo_of_CG06-09_8_20_14_all_59_86]PIQ66023.1 MAG: dinitrogenase iron-molybdenum cofactor biosynthesis protein [Zetaproteobacteria bacterium CG11_big_fil_rev_8_21_14_0_20_59_439]PIU71503.1 MAG: dinitrogenase iron-molybdenum cofactor biosynthesis protein [Zetaproteobacteria bacterium CG06_land_8_20_14_3_0
MAKNGLSRDLALRIGLAARAMPGIEPKTLLDALVEEVAMPLTASKLKALGADQLKSGALSTVATENLEQAMKFLRGEEGVSPRFAEPQAYKDGDIPGSIRVALASNGEDKLDGHFASCEGFLVYQVSSTEARLIDVRTTDGAADAEDKTVWLVDQIRDCHVLYVVSVGGPAAAKIIKAGLYPIKLPDGGHADEVLTRMQGVLAGSPPPWLAKILGARPEDRVRFESGEDDAWDQKEEKAA